MYFGPMLSKKAQYAFRALTALVEEDMPRLQSLEGQSPHDPAVPVPLNLLVQKHPMSVKFLETIFLQLRKAGILGSKKGKGGGYYLIRHPEDVPLAQVMRVLDGPIAQLPCVSLNFYEKCEGCNEQQCGLHRIMSDVRDAQLGVLENRSLWDLTRAGR